MFVPSILVITVSVCFITFIPFKLIPQCGGFIVPRLRK